MISKEMIEEAAKNYVKNTPLSYIPVEDLNSFEQIKEEILDGFKSGVQFAIEQLSEKVYSESDMYIIIQHIFRTTEIDGFFGGNTSFKKLYAHFINNKEKILHGDG